MTSFLSLVRALPRDERVIVLVLLRMAKARLSRRPSTTIWGTLEPRQKLPMYAMVQRRAPGRRRKKVTKGS